MWVLRERRGGRKRKSEVARCSGLQLVFFFCPLSVCAFAFLFLALRCLFFSFFLSSGCSFRLNPFDFAKFRCVLPTRDVSSCITRNSSRMSGAQEAAKSTSDPGSAVDPVVLGLVKFYAAVGVARAYDEIEQEAQGFLGDHLKKKAAFEEICAKYPNATDETMQQLRSAFFANDPVQTENVADANEVKEGGEDSSSSSSAPAAAPVLPDPVPAPTPHDVVVGVDVGAKNTTSAISTSDVAADVRSLRNANLSVAMPSCISLPGAPGGFRK